MTFFFNIKNQVAAKIQNKLDSGNKVLGADYQHEFLFFSTYSE